MAARVAALEARCELLEIRLAALFQYMGDTAAAAGLRRPEAPARPRHLTPVR